MESLYKVTLGQGPEGGEERASRGQTEQHTSQRLVDGEARLGGTV